MKWDGTIGPATLLGAGTLISTLVGIGILYGSLNEWRNTTTIAVERHEKENRIQDRRIANNDNRLTKIEAAVTFIGQSIERIEAAIAQKDK